MTAPLTPGASGMGFQPYPSVEALWTAAGWRCVLPLPYGQKERPPAGYTGAEGRDEPSLGQRAAWRAQFPQGNSALRLPADVIGLDVDGYNGKRGHQTLARHIQTYGPLPDTWTVINRQEGSGTRLFRTHCRGPYRSSLDGGDVDLIHRGHRYQVLPGSLHPQGRLYALYDPQGLLTDQVPGPDDLPWLPAAWEPSLLAAPKARGQVRLQRPARVTPPSPQDLADELSAEIARSAIASRYAATYRMAAGVSLDELAAELRLSVPRAKNLERGQLRQLRQLRRSLLTRYGRLLQEWLGTS